VVLGLVKMDDGLKEFLRRVGEQTTDSFDVEHAGTTKFERSEEKVARRRGGGVWEGRRS
jgi:hypothetical protein